MVDGKPVASGLTRFDEERGISGHHKAIPRRRNFNLERLCRDLSRRIVSHRLQGATPVLDLQQSSYGTKISKLAVGCEVSHMLPTRNNHARHGDHAPVIDVIRIIGPRHGNELFGTNQNLVYRLSKDCPKLPARRLLSILGREDRAEYSDRRAHTGSEDLAGSAKLAFASHPRAECSTNQNATHEKGDDKRVHLLKQPDEPHVVRRPAVIDAMLVRGTSPSNTPRALGGVA